MKKKEKKPTLGKIAVELDQKSHQNTHTAYDQMLESLTDWDKNLFDCVSDFKSKHMDNFYVVVITKKERLLPNVLRNYFMARISCPTPDYDQTVYRYSLQDDIIDFIWTIPSKEACIHITNHAMQLMSEESQLVQFVLDFADGTLFKLSKKLNGEQLDSPLLEI